MQKYGLFAGLTDLSVKAIFLSFRGAQDQSAGIAEVVSEGQRSKTFKRKLHKVNEHRRA